MGSGVRTNLTAAVTVTVTVSLTLTRALTRALIRAPTRALNPSPNPSPNPHLTKGGAEELGAATGLGAKNNVKRAREGKKVSQPVSLCTLTPLTGHGGYL